MHARGAASDRHLPAPQEPHHQRNPEPAVQGSQGTEAGSVSPFLVVTEDQEYSECHVLS